MAIFSPIRLPFSVVSSHLPLQPEWYKWWCTCLSWLIIFKIYNLVRLFFFFQSVATINKTTSDRRGYRFWNFFSWIIYPIEEESKDVLEKTFTYLSSNSSSSKNKKATNKVTYIIAGLRYMSNGQRSMSFSGWQNSEDDLCSNVLAFHE